MEMRKDGRGGRENRREGGRTRERGRNREAETKERK